MFYIAYKEKYKIAKWVKQSFHDSNSEMFMYKQENKHLMYTTVNSARMPFQPSYSKRNVEDDWSANAKSAEPDHLIEQTLIESKYLQSKVANRKESRKNYKHSFLLWCWKMEANLAKQ